MNEIPSFFSNIKSVQPLSNQEEPDNMQPKLFAVQSFFKNIYDSRQDTAFLLLQLKQRKLSHSRNNDCLDKEKNINKKLKSKLYSY